jgi:hypothetical protein
MFGEYSYYTVACSSIPVLLLLFNFLHHFLIFFLTHHWQIVTKDVCQLFLPYRICMLLLSFINRICFPYYWMCAALWHALTNDILWNRHSLIPKNWESSTVMFLEPWDNHAIRKSKLRILRDHVEKFNHELNAVMSDSSPKHKQPKNCPGKSSQPTESWNTINHWFKPESCIVFNYIATDH